MKNISILILFINLFFNFNFMYSSGPSSTKQCGVDCQNHKFAYRFCKVVDDTIKLNFYAVVTHIMNPD